MASQAEIGSRSPGSPGVRFAQLGIAIAAVAALLVSTPLTPAAAAAQPAAQLSVEGTEQELTAAAAEEAQPVTSDPLPTVQIDGIVYAQAVAANRVFAGGQFASARPAGAAPGTQLTSRSNLLSYNLTTGVLDTSFAPQVNGRIMAAATSPDGRTLYIGGSFTQVNGQARYRLAAFDVASGALLPNWRPGTNSTVFGLAVTGSAVYVAGQFTNISNTTRTGVAAVHPASGALLPFNPVHTGGYLARAVVVSPDGAKVVAAGSFLTTNGSDNPGRGMAALDAQTGSSLPWAVNSVLRNGGNNAAIYSLASDGTSVYGSGYDFGGNKQQDDFEGAFRASWADGTMAWMQDCHGDTYSLAPHNGILYTAAHTHYCGNIGEFPQLDPWYLNHSLAFAAEPSGRAITPDVWGYRSFTGNPAAKLLHWYPIWGTGSVSGIGQAGWSVASAGDYLLYGGEFTSINGVRQQGLVRFAARDVAPKAIGPTIKGGAWPITASSFREGEARVGWQANYDADSAELTYEVFRQGVETPLHTETVASTYWERPQLRFSDRTVQSGQTYSYRVRATDPDGNSTQSDWTSVTIAAPGSTPAYSLEILDDDPVHYWPLGEQSGPTGSDWAGGSDLTLTAETSRTAAGQATDGSTRATSFSGSSGSYASTRATSSGADTLSIEAWFRTSSTQGGKIVGFGNAATGSSSNYDRHIYLSGNGTITWGVHPGQVRTLQSAAGHNDGQWHHVVGTLDSTGMSLFVDGVRVGARSDTTSAQPYDGYWRVGGDTIDGWPNVNARFLEGSIADVAIYDRALTRVEVDGHRVASGRASTVPAAPADAYGASVFELDPTLYWRLGEASGQTARDAGPNGMPGSYLRSGSAQFGYGQAGAIADVIDTSLGFASSRNFFGSWTDQQIVASQTATASPATFSVETWFRTTSTRGGKLAGFGNSNSTATNASSSYDRHIMMTPGGNLQFGVWNGSANVLETSAAYNDGGWHHVVGQQSSSGMQLFVDGELAGSNAVTTAQPYTGYWRLGGDSTWVGDPFWVGSLDEFAVYGSPLTAAQVRAHYELATDGVANQAPTAEFSAQVTGLLVDVDASASTDVEGPVASYAWDFGDGGSATGETASHTYDEAGTYTVSLTVTDAKGLTDTTDREVSVVGPNVAPVAALSVSLDGTAVSVDGAGSSDPDGSIVSYAWDFGDGGTASGQVATHAYESSGTFEIELLVTDDRGATATATEQVTIVAPNQAPTAAFTAVASGMTVAFDATGSADPDGSIVGYAWDFGDGSTATGATPSRTFAVADEYEVTLTVTDDDGATAQVTRSVTAGTPVPDDAAAFDTFTRSATGSWGTPDVGPAWTTHLGNAAFGVSSGRGSIALAPSHTREARMTGVSSTDNLVEVTLSSDTASVGGTMSVDVIARQVGSSVYSTRVRLEPNGLLRVYLLRDQAILPGGNMLLPQAYVPGSDIHIRVQAIGTSPTTVRASVWLGDAAAPSSWMLSATDTTASMQASGSVALRAALSSVSTNTTQVLRFDDWLVRQG
ncbi:PKD domain-containing protein [Agrococcus sp. Marseille-P2731]|uniref:PKD domain-containing protein n=1 Tax=Agrococcus sp. Marseille-P2731 TaxID=1841862 RepID=UPI0013563A6C|nr:PKD domain-containing protein [Agrococcus sp. Marseille-P2731]